MLTHQAVVVFNRYKNCIRFFYGTAFVIGLLEIIAGELETGVIRFLAVSVKTFVLSVMSAAGLTLVLGGEVYKVWLSSSDYNSDNCFNMDLGDQVSAHYVENDDSLVSKQTFLRCYVDTILS